MNDERPFETDTTAPVAVADGSPNGTGDHPAESIEATDATESATAETTESAGATEATALEGSTDAAAEANEAAVAAPESEPDFVGQLVRAMQATAGLERARVGDEIDRRRAEHVAAIQSQRDEEQARMRELAADDRRAIDSWAESERRRIDTERSRRTRELEADLSRSLEEHGRQVDSRIAAVEAAITAHRADVDAFFARFESETDLVRIAQRAADRPAFPDLDAAPPSATDADAPAIVEAERTPAPEPSVVGVMDPISRLGLLRASPDPFEQRVASAGGSSPTTSTDTASAVDESAGPEVLTPVAARTSGAPEESAAAPAAHPIASNGLKRIGWLGRNHDQGDQS